MRVSWIDIVKGICMYCVVLSHTVQVPSLYRCIFEPFFLTAFFFLSGVVFKHHSIKKTLLNSTIKILWPYFINSVIIMLGKMKWIKLLYTGNITEVIIYFGQWWHKILLGDVFWFLACLFIVQVLATFIIHIFNSRKLYISIIAITCFASIFLISGKEIAPWSANTAIISLGYFLIGTICRDILQSFDYGTFKRSWGMFAMCLYLTIIAVIYITSSQPILFDLHTHKLSPELLYLSLSFIGIIVVCMFAMSLRQCKLLQILGENSLTIYMYHGYGGLVINSVFALTGINIFSTYHYIYTLIVSILTTFVTLIISITINKYFPILTGRGRCIDKLRKIALK